MELPINRLEIGRFQLAEVPAGTRAGWWLEVGRTPGGVAAVPLLVARGSRPGPTVMAVAGVHGDEFEGPAAIRDVFWSLEPAELAGSFVGLPTCNPWAYEALARATPPHVDGLNLARVFPGDPQGEPTQRLAHALLDLVRRNLTPADLVVDFHSSGTRYRYLPMIGYVDAGPAVARSREAARRFGIDLLWELTPEPLGRFNTQTALLGIPTLGTETYGQGGCRAADVAEYAAGLRHMLRWLGTTAAGPEPPVNPAEPARFHRLMLPESGCFRARAGLDVGDMLAEHDLIGTIADPFGQPIAEIRSPLRGRLVAIRTFAAVWAGDLAALIQPT